MNEGKAYIYYICHSGFVVKTKNYFLIFDFFKDPHMEDVSKKHISLPRDLIEAKNVFVFSSHNHEDHFNPEILNWKEYNADIKYIFSSDIALKENNENFVFISEGEEIIIKNLWVKAYGSTDIGISFLVKVDGLTLFHAGDLNCWKWKEDALEDQNYSEEWFKREVNKLIGNEIDVAFFPVDPRLEENYFLGGQYFCKTLRPKLFIPMHFANDSYITKEFADKVKYLNIKSAIINIPGEKIIF